ncbi:hypothetical protein [Acholeplasma laidlawii]|uniref:hypothetical protein n=1 Tax=Acholeplasma laidlawii TaxID=2148 RepID=UPI003F924514
MKKYIYLVLCFVLLLLSTMFIIYQSTKYPDNFLYDLGGYYKNNQILTMYESNNQIYALVRNNEITFDALDDDNCVDDMLNIAIIDEDFNLIELVEIVETKTLENDGNGIRSTEFEVYSYQDGDEIYISIYLYEKNYMVIFDTQTDIYNITETLMFLDTFVIENEVIIGVSSNFDISNDMYEITYYEMSKTFNVALEIELGHIDHVYQKPLVNSNYVFVQGNLTSNTFSWNIISRYNILTQTMDVIEDSDSYGIQIQYINLDSIIYSIHHVENENILIDYFNEEGTLIESSINDEFHILSIDESRFIHLQRDSDLQQQIIRVLDQNDNEEIVLEFNQRMYLCDIYYFNDSVYLIADMLESDLAQFLFGSHQLYILKYSVEELNNLK